MGNLLRLNRIKQINWCDCFIFGDNILEEAPVANFGRFLCDFYCCVTNLSASMSKLFVVIGGEVAHRHNGCRLHSMVLLMKLA